MSLAYSLNTDLEDRILKCRECEMKNRGCFPMEGPPFSTIMVIGQAPHPYRKTGQSHFSGKANGYFKYFLDTLGLRREEIFITNVIKCIDGNQEGSSEKCVKYLHEEIRSVNPKEIFLLGVRATKAIFGDKRSYGPMFYRGRHYYVLPHPAYCLRGQDEERSQHIRQYHELIESVKRYRQTLSSGDGQMTLDKFTGE